MDRLAPEAVRALVEGQAVLLAEVDRLEHELRLARQTVGDETATTTTTTPGKDKDKDAEQIRALLGKLAAAEAHIEQLRRENARIEGVHGSTATSSSSSGGSGGSGGSGHHGGDGGTPRAGGAGIKLPGMVTHIVASPSASPALARSNVEGSSSGSGGRWGREAALETVVGEQAEQIAKLDRDLRAATAEVARLREYSTFHVGYWRSAAQAHEAALARARAEKVLAERRASASATPSATSTEPTTPTEAATVAAAALRRARSPLSPLPSPGVVRRGPSGGYFGPPPRELVSKATQTEIFVADSSRSGGSDPNSGPDGVRTLGATAAAPSVDELLQELAQERERNGRLVDKLREQVELVQQTKRLLLAVGIGSGDGSSASATAALRRDWAPNPDGTPARPDAADTILPGTDEWEALLRERVRRDLAMEKDLRAAQDRAATVSQVEEERDAWRASTRQLEAALMAMSARCADLEYVLAGVPDAAKPAIAARTNGVRRFTSQPPPDLSVHGCPKCRESIVLVI